MRRLSPTIRYAMIPVRHRLILHACSSSSSLAFPVIWGCRYSWIASSSTQPCLPLPQPRPRHVSLKRMPIFLPQTWPPSSSFPWYVHISPLTMCSLAPLLLCLHCTLALTAVLSLALSVAVIQGSILGPDMLY